MTKRILIAGGYGTIGSTIARLIRAAGHDVHLILAGRNPEKGADLARELGNAGTAPLDVAAPDGAQDLPPADLMITALYDPANLILAAALARGAAHVGITNKADETAPVVAAALNGKPARPVVLLGHSMAGVATMVALKAAQGFSRIERLAVTGLFDPADPVGPMTAGDAEALVERAVIRENGQWRFVDGTQHPRLVEIGGEQVGTYPANLLDVPSLAAVTGAPNVRLDLGQGASLGTRGGQKASSDVYVDIEGVLARGGAGRGRTVLSDPSGLVHLTALGVLAVAERVLGLDGAAPPPGGLYLPEQLMAPDAALARYAAFGARILGEEQT